MVCNYIKQWTLLALCATVFVACSKPSAFDRELGLQSRLVELPAETGITPVIVYSNTSWHVHFVSPVKWAGLDRLSDTGSSQVKFSYAANYGRARKVALAFEAGGIRDTLVMIQASGLNSPRLEITPSSLSIGGDITKGKVLVTTNLREDLDEVKISVDYTEGETDWLSDILLSASGLEFTLAPNRGTEPRKATIALSHTDAKGSELRTALYVTQNLAE